jgi:hypothetical protein
LSAASSAIYYILDTMSSPPPTPSRSLSQSGPSSSYAAPPLSSSRNNPISLRIYKAIGTTFDDAGSREALELVSNFYAPTHSIKGKEKAEGDLVLTNGHGHGHGHEEEELPRRRTLKGQSAATARKYLKKDVERKLAEGSRKFLDAFGEVDQVCSHVLILHRARADRKRLNVLREHMQEMQIRCDQVQAELDQANSGTKYLLERADGLRSQRSVILSL